MADPAKFEDLALHQGIITPDQLEECRRIRDQAFAMGRPLDLEEVLLRQGYVTAGQASILHAASGRGQANAIEGFQLLSKVGQGGMGAVYKARQTSMDRIVALKVLLPKHVKGKDGVERFIREARTLAKLNHLNIVRGIDAGVSNGIYYFVMEFVDGDPVSRRLRLEKTLPWKEALSIVRQTAAALEHAAHHGLIHRDVKPANIILMPDGTAKLADLGMARLTSHDDLDRTAPGQIMGTPLYMSPEQARGEDLDIRTDLYSLGITFYEMLAGRPPYQGATPVEVLNKHLLETVPFDFPELPPEISELGKRLTEKDRARRLASPGELISSIERIEHPSRFAPPSPQPAKPKGSRYRTERHLAALPPSSRKSAAPAVGLAVLALAAAVVSASLFLQEKGPSPAPPVTAATPSVVSADPTPEPRRPTPAELAATSAVDGARTFEKEFAGEIEEVASRWAFAARKAAGTPLSGQAETRAREMKALLEAALARRRDEVGKNLLKLVDAGDFADARILLDRHAPDFKASGWPEWIGLRRKETDTALDRAAQALRGAADAAEARGAIAAALKALNELRSLGSPEAAREAEARIRKIEAARAEAMVVRKEDAERERRVTLEEERLLTEFMGLAEQRAARRQYERIDGEAPEVKGARAREDLALHLTAFHAAAEVPQAVREFCLKPGQTLTLEMRDGRKVTGPVTAIQKTTVLIGDGTYDVDELTTSSLIGFYRQARGAAVRPECLLPFAVLESSLPLAEDLLRKNPGLSLPPRTEKLLRRMQAERDAEAALRAIDRAKKEDPLPKLMELAEKFPATKAAETARKRMQGLLREAVVHAADLPKDALAGDFRFDETPPAAGGRFVSVACDGRGEPLPPTNPNHVTFKMPVTGGVPYRLWVHLRPEEPCGPRHQHVVHVQITGATDKTTGESLDVGGARYLTIRGDGKPGWGWWGRDSQDSRAVEPLLVFRSSGEVTVRLYEGNHGTAIDQVLLSPAKYLDRPPAEAILPKTSK